MKAKSCIVFVLVADESIDSAAMLDCISSFFLKWYFFCFVLLLATELLLLFSKEKWVGPVNFFK